MKVNNYLVTGADLATMGYTQKPGTTPPLDGSIMSKGEANANYYIDPNATPWSTYPDTRAPKYQDFPCPCVGDVIIYNDLEGGFDQTVTYEDCSGNEKYIFVAFGTAVAIQGCVTQDPGGYTGCGVLRGSVIGVNLRDVVYGTCCPGFTPCTPPPPPNQCNYNGLDIVCNTPPTFTLSWNLNKGTESANLIIRVNSTVQVNSSDTSSGTITVSSGDLVDITLSASDSFYVIPAFSTNGFGNDPFGYYAACDFLFAAASTPTGPTGLNIIGNCLVNASTTSSELPCS
jgi:hypothetical protein